MKQNKKDAGKEYIFGVFYCLLFEFSHFIYFLYSVDRAVALSGGDSGRGGVLQAVSIPD